MRDRLRRLPVLLLGLYLAASMAALPLAAASAADSCCGDGVCPVGCCARDAARSLRPLEPGDPPRLLATDVCPEDCAPAPAVLPLSAESSDAPTVADPAAAPRASLHPPAPSAAAEGPWRPASPRGPPPRAR